MVGGNVTAAEDAGKRSRADRPNKAFAILLAVAVIAALLIVAFWPRRRTVPVVGDSITVMSSSAVTNALGSSYNSDVEAAIGQRIDQMLPALEKEVARDPYAVIVELGTNDALQAQRHPDWRTGFDKMIALLVPQRCALLTTVATTMAPPADPGVAAEINSAIFAAADQHHNLHVIDWNAEVHSPSGSELLVGDHVHPSPAGQKRLAALMRAAVDNDCRRKLA